MRKPVSRYALRHAVAALAAATPALAFSQTPSVTVDKGDSAWMLVATVLVMLMIVPGLALFYGGLVRAKNILSVLMQVLVVSALAIVLWVAYGYSLAFDGGNAVLGGFGKLLLAGVTPQSTVATFSAGVHIPELIYIAFQGAFAAISCALVVGAIAERAKFGAVLLFTALWFTLAYLPLAHMVWAADGFLFKLGALDFAGGTVVHINAGVCGIVGALLTGVFSAPSLGGSGAPGYAMPHQLGVQALGIGITVLWSGVVALLAFWSARAVYGLRVDHEAEREGLDISSHGESAYEL